MAFAVMLAISTVVLNMTSYYEVIVLKKLPISFTTSLDLQPIHPNIMGWGSLSIITIVVLVSNQGFIMAQVFNCHNIHFMGIKHLRISCIMLPILYLFFHMHNAGSLLIDKQELPGSWGEYIQNFRPFRCATRRWKVWHFKLKI